MKTGISKIINFFKTNTPGIEIFAVVHLNSNLWRAFSYYIEKTKQGDPKKIKRKKHLQNFQKSLSWMLDLLLKSFTLTVVWLQVATWVWIKNWLSSPLILIPKASFRYIFIIALGRGCLLLQKPQQLWI